MEQVHHFPSGGFVVHKARISGSRCKFSAWFNADGSLRDAEAFTEAGKARFVKPGGPQWNELKRLARIYGPR